MSAADCCGICRSLTQCYGRCGMSVAAPGAQPPAPAIAKRQPIIGRWGALAISGGVAALGAPLWSLAGLLP